MSIVPGRIVEISGEWPGRTPKFPSVPGTTTISTSRETSSRSGVTSSNWTGISSYPLHCHSGARRGREPGIHIPEAGVHGFRVRRCAAPRNDKGREGASRRLGCHLAGLVDGLVDRADHVERGLRHLVVFAGDDPLKALDRVLEVD